MNTTQPHEHIVKSYDEEQRRISDEVVRMGQLAVSHSASNEVTDADATNPYQPGGDFNYIPDAVP